jgi:uncharacterized ion transporter superfamily protein YfcC
VFVVVICVLSFVFCVRSQKIPKKRERALKESQNQNQKKTKTKKNKKHHDTSNSRLVLATVVFPPILLKNVTLHKFLPANVSTG